MNRSGETETYTTKETDLVRRGIGCEKISLKVYPKLEEGEIESLPFQYRHH